MRKFLLVVTFALLSLAQPARAQFCPGVSPWVFDDVLASDPFCGFITWMADNGITLGCQTIDANHRLYCPNASVSRAAMAAFMNRLGDIRVEAVDTGPGLLGGPITGTGTVTLAPTQLLPTTACTAGQVPQWSGSAWTCGNAPGAGTVTTVATGAGLTGGPITTSGTILLATGYQLPQGCADGQVARSNGGSAWTCADGTGTGTVTSIVAGAGLTGGTITTSGTIAVDPASATLTTNFYRQGGNAFGTTALLGTLDANAVEIRAQGSRVMRFEPSAISPNIIGGSPTNAALGTTRGAFIGGGGAAPLADAEIPDAEPNMVLGAYGTVGGGYRNTAGWGYADVQLGKGATVAGGMRNGAVYAGATVGGGEANAATALYATVAGGTLNGAYGEGATAGGGKANFASAKWVVVAGGLSNRAWHDGATVSGGTDNEVQQLGGTIAGGMSHRALGMYAAIGGGFGNAADTYATVPGGYHNRATAWYSTVLGGTENQASGVASAAAGFAAEANSDGCFAWGDFSTTSAVRCDGANRFVARAVGGVYFFAGGTSQANYTGVILPSGGSSWIAASDRNLKENVVPVEPREVLERVVTMPIATWNLKTQHASIRHMGPMAQDFRAAFGVGETELGINTIDADGVALAAIQGLNAKLEAQLKERDARIAELRRLVEVLLARTSPEGRIAAE